MASQQAVLWPVDPATISEEAGTRDGTHYGMDFAVPVGTPVRAAFDGTIVWVGNDGAAGYLPGTWIRANGPALIVDLQRADGLIARYAHLSSFNVRQGQVVKAGDPIAESGNTGFTTGPHLHWELRWDRLLGPGAWVNPRLFHPQTFEEDDMYTDADRARDTQVAKQVAEIHWMLDQRIRPQLDRLEGITNGEGWGIRHLLGERRDEIAKVAEQVEQLAAGVPVLEPAEQTEAKG